MRDQIDPRFYNGGVLLGLNGVVVKSHGSADEVGFSSTIKTAAEMVDGDVTGRITANYNRFLGSARDSGSLKETVTS
jgi:glycerol-3-phosphate acyltransferase PlsX